LRESSVKELLEREKNLSFVPHINEISDIIGRERRVGEDASLCFGNVPPTSLSMAVGGT
jgi:hypothetical protein